MSKYFDALGALSTIASIAGPAIGCMQANQLHNRDLHATNLLHQEACVIQKQQFVADMVSELQQHFISLESDLLNASRESERDLVDQRNQHLNTLIVANTLMFGCSSAIIVQCYNFSDSSDDSYSFQLVFVIASALSMLFLLMSILITMLILKKIGIFMKEKAKIQLLEIEVSKKKTDEILRYLKTKDDDLYTQIVSGGNQAINVKDVVSEVINGGVSMDDDFGLNVSTGKDESWFQRFLTPNYVDRKNDKQIIADDQHPRNLQNLQKLFDHPETKEWSLLHRRRLIMSPENYAERVTVQGKLLWKRFDTSDKSLVKYTPEVYWGKLLGKDPADWYDARIINPPVTEILTLKNDSVYTIEFNRKMDFGVFWKHYCKGPGTYAENFFYLGIIFTMVSTILFIVDVFKNKYDNQSAEYTFASILGCGIFVIFGYIFVYYAYFEKGRTHIDFFVGLQDSKYISLSEVYDGSDPTNINKFIERCNNYCEVVEYMFDKKRKGGHVYVQFKSKVSLRYFTAFLNGDAEWFHTIWTSLWNGKKSVDVFRRVRAALSDRKEAFDERKIVSSSINVLGVPSLYLLLTNPQELMKLEIDATNALNRISSQPRPLIDQATKGETIEDQIINAKAKVIKIVTGLYDGTVDGWKWECEFDKGGEKPSVQPSCVYLFCESTDAIRAQKCANEAILCLNGNGIFTQFITKENYIKNSERGNVVGSGPLSL